MKEQEARNKKQGARVAVLALFVFWCLMLSNYVLAQSCHPMGGGGGHEGHQGMEMEGMSAEEHQKMQADDGVKVSGERQQLIGVKTEMVRKRVINQMVRTVGVVAYDPELYTAQTEYVEAVKAAAKAKEGKDQEVIANAEELIAAARLKLERLGLSNKLIEKLISNDQSLILGSEKGLVWVYGKIYESEIPIIKQGMTVHITSKNLPEKMFMGRVVSIDRILDETTRSVKIRSTVTNQAGLLKPNMFVDVALEVPLGKRIAVPEDALLDTGERQIVYIEKKAGVFEPRQVTVGQRESGLVEIVDGLREGEKVVTSGTFLLDSESKLKSTGGGHQH